MEPDGQLRNLRDFLLVYNRMTEICFQRCTNNFNYRTLTMDEERCVDNCAGKLIRSNHRLMGTYVKLMPAMVQRRMEELESKAAEAAKATEAIGPVEPTDITSTLAKPAPYGLTPASAAEVSGTESITILSAPSPSKNEAFVSPIPVTESAHKCSTEHPSKHASLDLTSPLLEGLHVSTPPAKPSVQTQESFSSASSGIALKNVDVNHIGIVNSSISPPASAHQSTGGERPPS